LHVDCDHNFECSGNGRDDVFVYKRAKRAGGTDENLRGELGS
jgi:hypothetical protein